MLSSTSFAAHAESCSGLGYSIQLMDSAIGLALSDKGVRAKEAGGSEEWNEDHCGDGKLFKVGVDGSAVDPRAYRGTWSVSGSGADTVVKYSYTVGGSSEYSWSLWSNASEGLCWGTGPGGNPAIATAPPQVLFRVLVPCRDQIAPEGAPTRARNVFFRAFGASACR